MPKELVSLSLAQGSFSCYLCGEVFIHPVTLPCRHSVCKLCLNKHFENNGFICPFCRTRVSNWLRKVKSIDANFVDTKFWNIIKSKFPRVAEGRLNGTSDDKCDPYITEPLNEQPRISISRPGEIRKEYEEFLHKEKEEICKEDEKNLRLSEALIKMLEDDETKVKEKQLEQLKADEELARTLAKELESESKQKKEDCDSRRSPEVSEGGRESPSHNESGRPSACSTPQSVSFCVPLDTPSTSKDDIFSRSFQRTSVHKKQTCSSRRNLSKSSSSSGKAPSLRVPMFSSTKFSLFTSVLPRTSTTSTKLEPTEVQRPVSPCSTGSAGTVSPFSSGSDSIASEMRHFKPIRTSPTTPTKEGSSYCVPQIVVAQRGVSITTTSTSSDVVEMICTNPESEISVEELEASIALEKQLERDRELAAKLQKEFDETENKRKRSGLIVKTEYNLRNKKRKGNIRNKVLVDRTQATLDSMLIK